MIAVSESVPSVRPVTTPLSPWLVTVKSFRSISISLWAWAAEPATARAAVARAAVRMVLLSMGGWFLCCGSVLSW